jgi:hypothetical protein
MFPIKIVYNKFCNYWNPWADSNRRPIGIIEYESGFYRIAPYSVREYGSAFSH